MTHLKQQNHLVSSSIALGRGRNGSHILGLCCFDCLLTVFDCFWRLVQCWYSLGRHVTIGTPMVIFAVLAVFWLFLAVFDNWLYSDQSSKTVKNSQKSEIQSKQQKCPLVYQSLDVCQDCTNSVLIVKNSQTVKNSQKTVKTAKMIIGVPIVTGLSRLYQQCTNRQKQSKDSHNSKNDYWCTNRHMSTKTVPTVYQSSKTAKRRSKQQKLVYQSSQVSAPL